MIEHLLELDRSLFLTLNDLHHPWVDPIMFWISKTAFWIPLYAGLLYLVIRNYKKQAIIVLLSIALVIVVSDQLTSTAMKPFFARLRPSRDPSLSGMVHLVNGYKGGKYGFASSHAANTFGVAMFFFLLFKKRYRWVTWLFIWAILVAYSRIYLGVHFPGDVLVGALVGLTAGWLGFKVHTYFQKNKPEATSVSG